MPIEDAMDRVKRLELAVMNRALDERTRANSRRDIAGMLEGVTGRVSLVATGCLLAPYYKLSESVWWWLFFAMLIANLVAFHFKLRFKSRASEADDRITEIRERMRHD